MTEPRIYCKTCGEFKHVGCYGGRNKSGWLCKSCVIEIETKKIKKIKSNG